jgi:hypothetical protein
LSLAQALSQAPQWARAVSVSTHSLPQRVSPAAQAEPQVVPWQADGFDFFVSLPAQRSKPSMSKSAKNGVRVRADE